MTTPSNTTPSLEEISTVLAKMIADKMEIDVATITPTSHLTELGLDSLDTFNIHLVVWHFNFKVIFGVKNNIESVERI